MKKRELPVEPERLRRQFPGLTDEDLQAYVQVTRRVLADPAAKAGIMRAVMATAQQARARERAGPPLTSEEQLALRYLDALEKMQARTSRS